MAEQPVNDEPPALAQPAAEIQELTVPIPSVDHEPIHLPDSANSDGAPGAHEEHEREDELVVEDGIEVPSGEELELEEMEDDWDSEDEFEIALEGLGDQHLRLGIVPGACTLEEAVQYRRQLRQLGIPNFIDATVLAGKVTAKKLCTAFGIKPPDVLEGYPDEAYYTLLSHGMQRELKRRQKLPEYNTIDDAVALVEKSRNIIVVTGAGISTSLGIPDFRSAGTGFYDRLAANGLTDRISEPSEVFDLSVFKTDPDIFFSVAGDILPPEEESTGKPKFTPTHAFIKLLEDHDRLLTNYTQNIDNIETYAGLSKDKIIQCHGSFATATCQKCGYHVPGETIFPQIRAKQIAYCPRCEADLAAENGSAKPTSSLIGSKRKLSPPTQPNKRRKPSPSSFAASDSDSDGDSTIPTPGILKPDITFFGEDLPSAFHHRIASDRHTVDLVVVIGTSLKVDPVASIPSVLDPTIPQIYISKTRCNHIDFDIEILGECDIVVEVLARKLGWELKAGNGREIKRGSVKTVEGESHRHLVFEEGKEEDMAHDFEDLMNGAGDDSGNEEDFSDTKAELLPEPDDRKEELEHEDKAVSEELRIPT